MPRLSRNKIDEAVNDWAKRVVKTARAALTKEKGISSKTLWRSIRYRYKDKTITFSMEDYGAFMDKGVSGTGRLPYRGGGSMPVPYNKSEAKPEYKFKKANKAIGGSLKRWLQSKGLPESLGFVIRRSIHARGIRPRRFFSDTFTKMLPEFDVEIGEAATVAVEETLDEILETLKK
jgi:hypothetical protein